MIHASWFGLLAKKFSAGLSMQRGSWLRQRVTACCAGAGCALLVGCFDDNSGPTQADNLAGLQKESVQDYDLYAIGRAVYGLDSRTPAGFYKEDRPYPDRMLITYHLKAGGLGIAGLENSPETRVCTDDFNTALEWSQTNSEQSGDNRIFVSNSETDWYYQFDYQRTLSSTADTIVSTRVFKCQKFHPGSTEDESYLGKLSSSPVSPNDVQWLAEYLWGFSPMNNYLFSVVDSTLTEDESFHTLVHASANTGEGVQEGCDRIDIESTRYNADSGQGDLYVSSRFEFSFDARREFGDVILCK